MVRPSLFESSPHLVINTPGLVALIQSLHLEEGDMLVKADVKDYFMSGSHQQLAEHASQFTHDKFKSDVFEATLFLLHHQYVNYDEEDASMFGVQEGAGMGLNASGDIADAAFVIDRERSFILQPHIIEKYAVKLHVRVKDDIFMIFGNSPHRSRIARDWDAICSQSMFCIDKWEASMWGVEVVDLHVFRKEKTSSRLPYKVHFKPSSLSVPLNPTSAHNPNILKSWPLAELDRYAVNSSSHCDFLDAKNTLIQRLESFLYPPQIVQKIRDSDPYVKKIIQKCITSGRSCKAVVSKSTTDIFASVGSDPLFWFVFPAHPIWERSGINACLKDFANNDFYQLLLSVAAGDVGKSIGKVSLRTAWKIPNVICIQD